MGRNHVTRRSFTSAALASGLPFEAAAQNTEPVSGPGPDESHIGTLYPFVQKLADTSGLPLSFLRPEFRSLEQWQKRARAAVLQKLLYTPAAVKPGAAVISQTDRGDYTEERISFQTTPLARVPAVVLIPKNTRGRAPAIVALHDHGGFYLWGKEKLVAQDNEHPVLTDFRRRYYSGRSITVSLVRLGYVVIVIDMLYWGERRLMYAADPEALKERS